METSVAKAKLENLEEVIASATGADYSRGEALAAIKSDRLYSARGFNSFDRYCDDIHGMCPSMAYRLIDLFSIGFRLSPIVDKSKISEFHARELKKLPATEQADAWQEAVELAGSDRVTARQIADVVSRRLGLKPDPCQAIEQEGCDEAASLESLIAAGRKFGTIYADPPWQYGNQGTRAATNNHYSTMTPEEIAAMPIGELAAEKCHLWVWTTNGFLFECPRIFEAWGFEFKSSVVWVKPQIGIGNYVRNAHEFLLLAIRGGQTGLATDVRSWDSVSETVIADRGRHSEKPEEFRVKVVERVSPGPRLELFARKTVEGWTVFGNQVERRLIPA